MEKRNLRKERIGIVTSNKMMKSIVVSEVKKVKHPMYGKFVLKTKKYVAHDEQNDCNEGDSVRIMETRPLSRSKCWRLVEIIERNENPEHYFEYTKLQMFQENVFCFTPKGSVIKLPKNATPIDFAYAVHTQVGDTAIGCEINGKESKAPK